MEKKFKPEDVLFWIAAVFPFVLSAAFYGRLPEKVATHFNGYGVPDGYSSRAFAAFGLPAIFLGCLFLVVFAMRFDPKYKNLGNKVPRLIPWFLAVFFIVIQSVIIGFALNAAFNVTAAIHLMVGILFIVIGNYLPKTKQNYTVGIKLPWTLESTENWNRTHRIGGFVWVIGGALMIVLGLLGRMDLFFAVLIVMVGVPFAYSFYLYRKGI